MPTTSIFGCWIRQRIAEVAKLGTRNPGVDHVIHPIAFYKKASEPSDLSRELEALRTPIPFYLCAIRPPSHTNRVFVFSN
jgi:hypothetical protein